MEGDGVGYETLHLKMNLTWGYSLSNHDYECSFKVAHDYCIRDSFKYPGKKTRNPINFHNTIIFFNTYPLELISF